MYTIVTRFDLTIFLSCSLAVLQGFDSRGGGGGRRAFGSGFRRDYDDSRGSNDRYGDRDRYGERDSDRYDRRDDRREERGGI